MKINGKWKINYVDVSQTRYVLFDFISNNQRFIGMDLSSLVFITHFDESDIPYGVNFVDDDYNIVSEYSTISIIGEAEVDELLIVPFKMEKISDVDTIPMTHPKGIRLLTKGKKCTEDIEVVPTFEIIDVETVEINVVCTSGRWVITIFENGQIKNRVVEDGEIVQAVAGSYARSVKDDPDNTFSSYVDIEGEERSYVAITDEGNNDYVYQLDWDGTLEIK